MNNSQRFELLKAVQKFYSIGLPYDNYRYGGYEKLRRILEDKIIGLKNFKVTPWTHLMRDVEYEIEQAQILDLAGEQFPNFISRIELGNEEFRGLVQSKALYINISLLIDYYTVFYESTTRFKLYSDEGRFSNPRKVILYGEGNARKEELELLHRLKEIAQVHFPEYRFIAHHDLFHQKITGGLPHGEDAEAMKSQYSFYRFLFGFTSFEDVTEVVD